MLATDLIPLEALAADETGRLVEIVGGGACRHRLTELGLREGTLIRLIQRGSPCILGIGEHRLSFRPEPGVMLLVEPVRTPRLAFA